MKHKKAEGFEL